MSFYPRTDVPSVMYVEKPTVSKIRTACQSLAGRNNYPYDQGKYHGFIDPRSVATLIPDVLFIDIPNELEIGNVLFKVTPAVNGALVFGLHNDPLSLGS